VVSPRYGTSTLVRDLLENRRWEVLPDVSALRKGRQSDGGRSSRVSVDEGLLPLVPALKELKTRSSADDSLYEGRGQSEKGGKGGGEETNRVSNTVEANAGDVARSALASLEIPDGLRRSRLELRREKSAVRFLEDCRRDVSDDQGRWRRL
jgi:hypothetical protein